MAGIDRKQGHLIVAAVRVLAHQLERSPRPEEVADLLQQPAALLRVQLVALQEIGILALVESAFDTHVEIRDYLLLEDLPAEATGDLESDLAEFDRRKLEEAERMGRLFADGEHERRQQDKMRRMEEELRGFPRKRKKPRGPSPFGDDEPESES